MAASIPDEPGPYWITPEVATLWLSRNSNNRPIRQRVIAAFAKDMTHEQWTYTGEAIKFTTEGRLIDGQHRLHAVIASGATVKMMVILDLDADAQTYMDSGIKRTAGDALAFRGEVNSMLLGAAVRFAIGLTRKGVEAKQAVTHAEIINWLADHPEIRRYVGLTHRYQGKIDMKPSVFAYALWRLSQIDERDAKTFLMDIVEMRSTGAGDPVYTLLQRFRSARKHREYLNQVTELSFVYRSWNAFRTGQKLKVLKVPAGDWDLVEPK